MPNIDLDHLDRMRRAYRKDVADYLQAKAMLGETVTYTELTETFGRNPRMWGDPLGGIALACWDRDLPILSVLVVNKNTNRPSEGAVLYHDLGLTSPDLIDAERERCFAFDWSQFPESIA